MQIMEDYIEMGDHSPSPQLYIYCISSAAPADDQIGKIDAPLIGSGLNQGKFCFLIKVPLTNFINEVCPVFKCSN